MDSKKTIVLPKFKKIFEQIGENIKLARKRRKLTTGQVSERAGIHRATPVPNRKWRPGGCHWVIL